MASAFVPRVTGQVITLDGASSYANLLLMLLILIAGGVAISQIGPPRAVPDNAPLNEFSSGRAMAHLQEIAKKPHPQGSAEHRVVRDYICQQLSSLGASPQIQTATIANQDHRGIITAATVENIVAKVSGT